MRYSKTVRKAEEVALAGANESDDSQKVLEAYQRQYGLGLFSSSPVAAMNSVSGPMQQAPQPSVMSGKHAAIGGRNKFEPLNAHTSRDHMSGLMHRPENDAGNAEPAQLNSASLELQAIESLDSGAVGVPGKATACAFPQEQRIVEDTEGPTSYEETAPLRKMDFSQSPTQSNDGRSYEKYMQDSLGQPEKLSAEQPKPDTAHRQSPSTEQRTLDENDTGAVVFDFARLAAVRTHSVAIVDEDEDGVSANAPDQSSPGELAMFDPETPAAPRNPFLAKNQSQLMRASQLFAGTQFSSAVKKASPTSSRPSPDDLHPKNSISPNRMTSSPLKTRGFRSSPIMEEPSSSQGALHTTPAGPQLQDVDDATSSHESPESPEDHATNARVVPEPMSGYEPMRISQSRRANSDNQSDGSTSSDESEMDHIGRRNRVQQMRTAADQELEAIRFNKRAQPIAAEPISMKKRRRTTPSRPVGRGSLSIQESPDEKSQETVADSQEQRMQNAGPGDADEETIRHSGNRHAGGNDRMPSTAPPLQSLGFVSETPAATLANKQSSRDVIPETSPADGHGPTNGGPSNTKTSITQHIQEPRRTRRSARRISSSPSKIVSGPVQPNSPISSAPFVIKEESGADKNPVPTSSLEEVGVLESEAREPELPPLHLAGPPPAHSTRSKKQMGERIATQRTPVNPSSTAPVITSALSALRTTPIISSSTTPATQAFPSDSVSSADARDSKPLSRAQRATRRRSGGPMMPPKFTAAAAAELRASGRTMRQQALLSTDELAQSSPCATTLEHNLRPTKRNEAGAGSGVVTQDSASRDNGHKSAGLFDDMVFAVSFQPKKPGEDMDSYGERMRLSKEVCDKITQAGGRVLPSGFDELFVTAEPKSAATSPATPLQPGSEIKMLPHVRGTGFTALIADGHSRKVKYMQALALGLPCIAPRWITTCVNKNEIVDWSPYLLCAGVSSFLGDAIRSRNLPLYDASSTKLIDMIKDRPLLLGGSRIIVVMKKATEDKKMAYVFLASVLGASLTRVSTVEEARNSMKQMEDLGQPYDWVYLDDTAFSSDQLFSAAPAPEGKKRKRGSRPSGGSGVMPKKIQVLTDELVIQSLILGRLMEEDEMEEQ